MLKKLIILVSIFLSGFCYAEQTIFQTIGPVNFNGTINVSFFRGDLKWGAPGCPNATYVQIKAEISGRKEILSIALAAKMAGKKVQFWGSCNSDLNYFDAFYIIVE